MELVVLSVMHVLLFYASAVSTIPIIPTIHDVCWEVKKKGERSEGKVKEGHQKEGKRRINYYIDKTEIMKQNEEQRDTDK